MVDFLENYFEEENGIRPVIKTMLTAKLARDIRRYWKSDKFQEMIHREIESDILKNIKTIVAEYDHSSGPHTLEGDKDDDDVEDSDNEIDFVSEDIMDSPCDDDSAENDSDENDDSDDSDD